MHQSHIAGEILRREPRVPPARVGLGEARGVSDLSREQAAAERRIGDEADFKLAGGAQRLLRLGPV